MRLFFVCLIGICVGASSGAAADEDNPASLSKQARTERARRYFALGQASFKLGDYDDAIDNFRHGYELVPQPLFLYNIANSAHRAGKLELAKQSYTRYLGDVSKPAERKEIQRRIAEIDAELADRPVPIVSAPAEPAPTVQPTVAVSAREEPNHEGRTKTIVGFTLAGVGLAALAGGGALVGLAGAANSELAHPAPGTVFDPSIEDRRNHFAPAGISLLVVGGALVVAGTTLGVLGLREHARAASDDP